MAVPRPSPAVAQRHARGPGQRKTVGWAPRRAGRGARTAHPPGKVPRGETQGARGQTAAHLHLAVHPARRPRRAPPRARPGPMGDTSVSELEHYREPSPPDWVATLEPAWIAAGRLVRATEFIPAQFHNRQEAIMAAILTGAELGRGPLWSLRNLNVIQGRASLSAEAMRSLIQAAGHEIWPLELTDQSVTMAGRRRGSDNTVTVPWTMANARSARLAEKQTWRDYPRAMLTARATTELARLMFADVIAGIPATEETQDGYPLEPQPLPEPPLEPATRQWTPPEGSAGATGGQQAGGPAAPPPPAGPPPDRPPLPGDPTHLWPGPLPVPEDCPELEQAVAIPGTEVEPPRDEVRDRRRLMAMVGDAFPGVPHAQRERWRYALAALVTRDRPEGPVVSFQAL